MFTVYQGGVAITPVGGVSKAEADAYVAAAAAEKAEADAAWAAWADIHGGPEAARALAVRRQLEAEAKAADFDDYFSGQAAEKAAWLDEARQWERHAKAMTGLIFDRIRDTEMARLNAEMDAAMARVLGSPARAEAVEQLASLRDALRRTLEARQ